MRIFFPAWGQISEIGRGWPSHPLIVNIIFISSILLIISKGVIIAVIVILIVILMIISVVIALIVTIHLVLDEGLAIVGVVFHVVAVEVLVGDMHHRHWTLDTPLYKLVFFLRPTK